MFLKNLLKECFKLLLFSFTNKYNLFICLYFTCHIIYFQYIWILHYYFMLYSMSLWSFCFICKRIVNAPIKTHPPETKTFTYVGDVIHLYGFYPETGTNINQRPSSSHRPTSLYKPSYNYGDTVRPPQQWDVDNNQLLNPSGFYAPNAQRPAEAHRPSVGGLVSGGGVDFGADSDDLFVGNNGNVYANGQHFAAPHSSDDGIYRPVLGKSKETSSI